MQCDSNTNLSNLTACIEDINAWSSKHFLKLNKTKTKVLSVSSKSYTAPKITHLSLLGEEIKVETAVKNLGFFLDENLTMEKQINNVCSQGYRMLKNLWQISRKVVDKDLRTQLVHSGILSKVNYCNTLYNSLPNKEIRKLQKLINSSTRFIFNIKGEQRYQHITPYNQQLHFLPANCRSTFKICLTVYKYFNQDTPLYISELIEPRKTSLSLTLRKDNDNYLLEYKALQRQNYKTRGFSYTAPTLWNMLPYSIRSCTSVKTFKTNLKTYFYNKWINGEL